ncbi:MAG: glycoside hydrolase family 10 protein [Candidatus Fervidibacter sp.]|uniref:glycoside hydrolase family 10 protein n=1 Tax=Candidatus Fervidibacter sp. TaxID=3100871 RepID=UPI00404A99A8
MKIAVVFALITVIALPLPAQILVVRDDMWAATSTENRILVNRQVESVERWLRRLRIPYQRVNASSLKNGSGYLFVLPANRPNSALLAKLKGAYRIVAFAFAGDQISAWQKALSINASNGVARKNVWVVVFLPFAPDLPEGEKAELLATWLLDGTTIPKTLQESFRSQWREWHQSLQVKRRLWLQEIASRPYHDLSRKSEVLAMLQQQVAEVPFSLTPSGTVWLERLQKLLSEHERVHKALAISLEPREGEIRGIWLHTYGPTDWEAVMKTVKDANLNCLFFRAGRGGNVVYRSQFLPRDPWAEQADLDELKNATEAASRYGIELHAWRVNHHFGTAPDWFKEQMAKEERLVRDPHGKQAMWLNPADPRNREHEFSAMMELLNYDVAGVHFDYIRYPEVPHYDFDYSEISRREFEKSTGVKLTDFPGQVLLGPLKILYDDWQRDNITNLVRRVYFAVKDVKPKVAVSAAVWQRHRYYYSLIKQDWMRWVRERILDFVCPMDYTGNNDAFFERVREQVLEVNGQIPIAIGIGAYLHTDEWQFVEQVKVARDLGADGFVIFSYNIAPLRDFLTALNLGATSQPTYPAHQAPQITFNLSDGVRLKDSPIIYRAGEQVRFAISISPGLLEREVKELGLTLQWERYEGFAERIIAEANIDGSKVTKGAILKGETKIPSGTVRMVARGRVVFADGSTQPFTRRGLFVKGVKTSEFHRLVQSLLPYKPKKRTKRPIVGVVEEGRDSSEFVKILKSAGYEVFTVKFLEPTYWEAADILLVPPLSDIRGLTYRRALGIRDWVAKGGKIVLLSEACGYRAHPNLFPEVGIVTGEMDVKTATVGGANIKLNSRSLVLRPQSGEPKGFANGNVIIVKGKFGKGTVIQFGFRENFDAKLMRLVIGAGDGT